MKSVKGSTVADKQAEDKTEMAIPYTKGEEPKVGRCYFCGKPNSWKDSSGRFACMDCQDVDNGGGGFKYVDEIM